MGTHYKGYFPVFEWGEEADFSRAVNVIRSNGGQIDSYERPREKEEDEDAPRGVAYVWYHTTTEEQLEAIKRCYF